MSIEMKCPACGRTAKIPDHYAGKVGKCKCGFQIQVPSAPPPALPVIASSPPSPPAQVIVAVPQPMADTKACPYCGETIAAVALICKHCGTDLAAGPRRRRNDDYDDRSPRLEAHQTVVVNAGQGTDGVGTMALICGLIGLCFFPAALGAILFGLLGRGTGATVGLILGLAEVFLVVVGFILLLALGIIGSAAGQ